MKGTIYIYFLIKLIYSELHTGNTNFATTMFELPSQVYPQLKSYLQTKPHSTFKPKPNPA